jgi:hypothetical protein
MAAPDALMDLIPVTEQAGIYGRPLISYRGVFDPLDFGFNDNHALNSAWRGAVSYVTGAHNMKVGYSGSFTDVRNGRVPNHTQLRYTFNAGAPATASCTTQDGNRLCPVAVSYFSRHAGISTIATETMGLYAQDQWTDQPPDAAGRRPFRPRVELGARRKETAPRRRRASIRGRSASTGPSASADTTTSRRVRRCLRSVRQLPRRRSR